MSDEQQQECDVLAEAADAASEAIAKDGPLPEAAEPETDEVGTPEAGFGPSGTTARGQEYLDSFPPGSSAATLLKALHLMCERFGMSLIIEEDHDGTPTFILGGKDRLIQLVDLLRKAHEDDHGHRFVD